MCFINVQGTLNLPIVYGRRTVTFGPLCISGLLIVTTFSFLTARHVPSFRCVHSRIDSSVGIVTRLRTVLPGMRAVVLGRNKLSLLHSVDLLFGPTQPPL